MVDIYKIENEKNRNVFFSNEFLLIKLIKLTYKRQPQINKELINIYENLSGVRFDKKLLK